MCDITVYELYVRDSSGCTSEMCCCHLFRVLFVWLSLVTDQMQPKAK